MRWFFVFLIAFSVSIYCLHIFSVDASLVDAVYVTDTGSGVLESSYTPSRTFPWLTDVRFHLSGSSAAEDKLHVFFVSSDVYAPTSLLYTPTSLTDVVGYNTTSIGADARISFNPPVYIRPTDSIGIRYDNTNLHDWGLSFLFRR